MLSGWLFHQTCFSTRVALLKAGRYFQAMTCFFYGRFISHDGKQRNRPVMRFGNISMLPDQDAPVGVGDHDQLAFLVECRSLGGFSGSSAFVKLSTTRMMRSADDKREWIPTSAIRLLGVDCA